jgi:hypothetical protein
VSRAVTVNVFCETMPDASVAVTVTSVVPTGNVLPDGGFTLTVGAG